MLHYVVKCPFTLKTHPDLHLSLSCPQIQAMETTQTTVAPAPHHLQQNATLKIRMLMSSGMGHL